MTAADRPLMSLTAGELMSRAVVMVPQEMSLEGAARLLSQAQVSGAPVVDTDGRCVGVLSATDFVHWAQKGVRAGVSQDCVCSSWQIVATDCLPKEAVRHYMTKDPVTVTSGARIGDLAQMMIDAHIHRVIVVDREHRPIGIVSSTDILAALAHSVRAAASPGKNTRTPVASA